MDGVLVPTVTQAEKDRRRRDQAVRRQQRSAAGVGNAKPHAFAMAGDSDAFGPRLAAHAAAVGFEAADHSLSANDGAKWIAAQVCPTPPAIKRMRLDFYPLSQHVHAAARCCPGEGTPAAVAA